MTGSGMVVELECHGMSRNVGLMSRMNVASCCAVPVSVVVAWRYGNMAIKLR